MFECAGIGRQAEILRLRNAVEAELGRSPFCVGLRKPLRSRYCAGIAAARSRELTLVCLCGSVLYLLVVLLLNLFAQARPDWAGLAVDCTVTPFLALSIAYVSFRPESPVLIREGGALVAASCFSLATLAAIRGGGEAAGDFNLFLVSLAVVAALFFVHLRFAAAMAFVGLTALALWLAAPALPVYPLGLLLAISAPALFCVHRHERSARDMYLNALLQDMRIEQLALENNLLSQLSATDPLTGAANRRRLEDALRTLCAQPGNGDFLLLADIDFFKRFNDDHGHMAGDACLREVVAAIRRQLRRTDLVARFGGEEFAIILPRTTYDDALVTAERIRAGVANQCVIVNGRAETVTVSIGLAERRSGMAPMTLLSLADNALYAAKHAGRNRIRCAVETAQAA